MRSSHRALPLALLALAVARVGSLQQYVAHLSRTALQRCEAKVGGRAGLEMFDDRPGNTPQRPSESLGAARMDLETANDELSFFSPGRRSSPFDEEDDNDDLLPPPLPEQIRPGELGETTREDDIRPDGFYAALVEEPDRLRGSDLNEVLQPDHLNRLRFTNFPLQAYGALFKWEVLVEDVLEIYRAPWEVVAREHGLPMPSDDEVLRVVGMRPERAIMQIFRWSDDWGKTQQLAFEHFEAKGKVMRERSFEPADGVLEWLHLLKEYSVPCCLCAGTSLGSAEVSSILSSAGLDGYFESCVTAEDSCETAEQTYLVGCVKLRRPPEKCVAFEDDPKGVVAAHEAMVKAVAVLGNFHGGELRHADMRVSALDELSLMSLRELFKDARMI